MSAEVPLRQKLAGVIAFACAALLIVAPVADAAGAVAAGANRLNEQRQGAAMLAARISDEREQLLTDRKVYDRALRLLETENVPELLLAQCEIAAASFSEVTISSRCELAGAVIAGDLMLHSATLSTEGDMTALLGALDDAAPIASDIQVLNISTGPRAATAAPSGVLEIRFSDLSDRSEPAGGTEE
jgi:hypothetical protein